MNIVFNKYKEGNSFFDPCRFLDEFDTEKYFELLKDWKEEFEIYHLRDLSLAWYHIENLDLIDTKEYWEKQRKIEDKLFFYFFRATLLL